MEGLWLRATLFVLGEAQVQPFCVCLPASVVVGQPSVRHNLLSARNASTSEAAEWLLEHQPLAPVQEIEGGTILTLKRRHT